MAEKPKILVFTTAYAPFIGGAEVAVEQVSKRLKDKFDFVIITSRMRKDLPKREVRNEGVAVRVGFGTRFDKYLFLVFGPFRVFSDFGFHASDLQNKVLLWGVDLSFGSLAAAILKLFWPRVPLVFNIQYGDGEERISKGRFGLMNFAFKLILGSADYVTAISSYLLNLCKAYGFIGEQAVIHNGVDIQKFKNQNAKSKMTDQNSKIIITVSRLVPKNGIDILIKAVAELKIQLPTSNFQLLIIGDGEERPNLEHMAYGLGLTANTKFFGEIPYDEIPKYLTEADIFVRSSRSEGMGNAFIEALAAGLPIIGTPVGGILDIIEDGKTGLFAKVDDPKDLAEKIKTLLEDRELAARIVENGRRMVKERFSWDKIAETYGALFEKQLAVKKRVLVATGLFPPDVGGPATYSKILLDELPQQGIGVRVLGFRSVRNLPKVLRHIVYFIRTLWLGGNADIIFAQDPVSVGYPVAIAAKILRKRFILKIVGDYAWEQGTQRFGAKEMLDDFLHRKYGWRVEFLRKIQKFVSNRAAKIIVPSEYLKRVVTKWGIDPEKISVVYNAFDMLEVGNEKLEVSKELARAELGLDGKVLVSAGRLVPWKGFDLLIEVVMDLLISYPEIKLVIIGDGPKREALERKAYGLKLMANVVFTGALPREKLLKYLIAADAFVLNTAYEGMSHQILEAMSLGVPIVTTDAGGNSELIKDGESGFLVKFNDKKVLIEKISQLLSDNNLANLFADKAKKKAEEFSLPRMINETIKVLI